MCYRPTNFREYLCTLESPICIITLHRLYTVQVGVPILYNYNINIVHDDNDVDDVFLQEMRMCLGWAKWATGALATRTAYRLLSILYASRYGCHCKIKTG